MTEELNDKIIELEIRNDFLKRNNETKQEKIEKLNKQVVIMEKYLELIYDLGFDYDGCNTIEGLKGLIDDLVHCASLGRACNTTEPIYTNMGKHYNILHEEIGVKDESK